MSVRENRKPANKRGLAISWDVMREWVVGLALLQESCGGTR